jgi:hypothetical protein
MRRPTIRTIGSGRECRFFPEFVRIECCDAYWARSTAQPSRTHWRRESLAHIVEAAHDMDDARAENVDVIDRMPYGAKMYLLAVRIT